ncbi:MAG: hypothetical protein HND47_13545 [Chloroflexi bacterium]|nr:hypothetical protein [Chloroflexota bacterium]
MSIVLWAGLLQAKESGATARSLPINRSVKREEKKWMKKVPSQAKGGGTFSFWGDFEAGIPSTGSLPDPRPGFEFCVYNWLHRFTLRSKRKVDVQ